MKRLFEISLGVLLAALIVSCCTKDKIASAEQDVDMVLVNLNLTGEVTPDEEPLTRALTSNDLIGVQVYQGSAYYAFGLFDDVSKISLYLNSNQTYKFVCTVVKNGKDIVYHRTTSRYSSSWYPPSAGESSYTDHTKQIYEGEYSSPFLRSYYNNGNIYRGTKLENVFHYYDINGDYYHERFTRDLEYGTIASGVDEYQKYPQAERFYGEVSSYQPDSSGSLSIPLKRVSFGIALTVSGVTDGNVEVSIKNSVQTFVNNTGITTDSQFGTTIWSFYDLKSAWQYADDYAENFTVGVVWNRGVGVTQDLGTKVVQFKRNVVNNVIINLSSTTGSSGLAVTLEEPELTSESFLFGN